MLNIVYFTDPLCCWSWGFEPQWRRLIFEHKEQIEYRYCMGGLLPGWKNYHDEVNMVSRPLQMGPVWLHAQQLSGMPVRHDIWMHEPPASSYPACLAVKCAGLQSAEAEGIYLRMVREAVMVHALNISKHSVLLECAKKAAAILPSFNITRFKDDLVNDHGIEPFQKDLAETEKRKIKRFPSLLVRNDTDRAMIISGYHSYEALTGLISKVEKLEKKNIPVNENNFKGFWPSVTDRELTELRRQEGSV